MRRFATFLAAALVVAVGAAGSTAASAQAPNCGDLYNHLMGLYQAAPQSPEYSQMSAFYSANCLAGASAAPAYAPYYQPPSYGYAEPDYPYYGGYGYAVPVGVGIGLGFGRGFHHDGGFHGRDFDRGGGFHHAGGFQGGGGHSGGGQGGGGHGGGGHGGDGHGDHH